MSIIVDKAWNTHINSITKLTNIWTSGIIDSETKGNNSVLTSDLKDKGDTNGKK